MNIKGKIEEIKQKPEHIRLRWAWGMTFATMILIVIVWLLSIRAQISQKKEEQKENKNNVMVELKDEAQSLKETAGKINDMIENKDKVQP